MSSQMSLTRAARTLGAALTLTAAACGEPTTPALADAAAPAADAQPSAAGPAADGGGDAAPPGARGAALQPEAFQPYPRVNYPRENPFQQDKARLGKILFWDEQLSDDDSVACGTCHRPSAGGADPRPALPGYRGHPGPDGVRDTPDDPRGSPGLRSCGRAADGSRTQTRSDDFGTDVQVTRRRAMSMADAMFWPALFWDGRAADRFRDPLHPENVVVSQLAALETQAMMPLTNPVEMACDGRTLAQLGDKLRRVKPLGLARDLPQELRGALADPTVDYPRLFEASFGSDEITPARIGLAIATYERTLTSDQTPWDAWRAGDASALDPEALHGLAIYAGKGGCSCCHPPPLFGSQLFVNDGLSLSTWDEGRAEVTKNPRDLAAFRVPGLRKVGLREAAGLLHDGRAPGDGLPALVDAYTQAPLTGGNAVLCVRRGFDADDAERAALVAFLRRGLTDPRMQLEAAPFDRPKLASEQD